MNSIPVYLNLAEALGATTPQLSVLFRMSPRSTKAALDGSRLYPPHIETFAIAFEEAVQRAHREIAQTPLPETILNDSQRTSIVRMIKRTDKQLTIARKRLATLQLRHERAVRALRMVRQLNVDTLPESERAHTAQWLLHRETMLRVREMRSGFEHQLRIQLRIAQLEATKNYLETLS